MNCWYDNKKVEYRMREKTFMALLIEDNPEDTRLIREMIKEVGGDIFDLECVDRLSKGLECFYTTEIDVVLLDLSLSNCNGINAFVSLHNKLPKVPIVVLSDINDETMAIRVMQEGAQDHLVKGEIDGKLLVRSIRYAIERQKLLCKLQETKDKAKTLHGILPICAYCKMIRDPNGSWNPIEEFICNHSEADFTHSICPDCQKKNTPQLHMSVNNVKSYYNT